MQAIRKFVAYAHPVQRLRGDDIFQIDVRQPNEVSERLGAPHGGKSMHATQD